MDGVLLDLIGRLDTPALKATGVIQWSCPVPVFGDLLKSVVATLGLNPSNREFVDDRGKELEGAARRLPTLQSLRLSRWSQASPKHLGVIQESWRRYFTTNPYNGWFRSLDYILSGANFSYYGASANACHLDLIPFATKCKWTELSVRQRSWLLKMTGDALGRLLRDSPIRLLILNGRTVVENLQKVADVVLDCVEMEGWTLPRRTGHGVPGVAFRGTLTALSGVELGRAVTVLGYNHNIQSSFGVTAEVKAGIRDWLSEAAKVSCPCDPETRRQQHESTRHFDDSQKTPARYRAFVA